MYSRYGFLTFCSPSLFFLKNITLTDIWHSPIAASWFVWVKVESRRTRLAFENAQWRKVRISGATSQQKSSRLLEGLTTSGTCTNPDQTASTKEYILATIAYSCVVTSVLCTMYPASKQKPNSQSLWATLVGNHWGHTSYHCNAFCYFVITIFLGTFGAIGIRLHSRDFHTYVPIMHW